MTPAPPLTLGTAGHIDHGKTTLIHALTGIDTDRLPDEKARGISIELGYAPLALPSGRRLSVVDVPGHQRFVRTMVAGATGIDLFLMVIAADDGVMPQTVEHAAVLRALGVTSGVVAVTKADAADPSYAAAEAAELMEPWARVEVVACSGRTGAGVDDVRAALDRAAAPLRGRGDEPDAPILHVDRVFTIRGAGTVVTGTLWSGAVAAGDRLALLPAGRPVRVRSVQVHDEPAERAAAGQRVALNLAGITLRDVARGDVVAGPGAVAPTRVIDCELQLREARHGMRAHVHHGTREAPARLADLGDGLWQARLERPLLARPGDRVVVRSIAPPDTLGGGVVLDAAARRHGRRAEVLARLARLRRGEPEPEPISAPEPALAAAPSPPVALSPSALELEERLRAAGHEPPNESELDPADLRALREAGRAVRIGRAMYAHPDAIAAVRARVEAVIAADGAITLAGLRDELATSRRYAQALLEHLDAERVTKRLPDDSRVLRHR
ncbi:MAG TPA: selenocysteine-specific translation elongation factor [Solirubrobacteraceae bacterium]